jgi:hypothetical protein
MGLSQRQDVYPVLSIELHLGLIGESRRHTINYYCPTEANQNTALALFLPCNSQDSSNFKESN